MRTANGVYLLPTQPARASKPSDNARRTESNLDGQAPTLPIGKGKHARNLRNDAQTEEWERETDERYEAKDAADRAERQAKRHTDQEPSYHSRSEDESPRSRPEVPQPSGHDSEALRNARPLPKSPQAAVAILDMPTPPKPHCPMDPAKNLTKR